jgi:hypothetical protein
MLLGALLEVLDPLTNQDCVRLVNYGQKAPWHYYQHYTPILAQLPWRRDNTWDIGNSVQCEGFIALFKIGEGGPGGRQFPMLGPLGAGFGSIQFRFEDVLIKVYPRLVHALKAYSSTISIKAPQTVRTLRSRQVTLHGLRLWLRDNAHMLGGFRFEARVHGHGVEQARQRVIALGIHSLQQLEQTLHQQARLVPIGEYLDFLDTVWQGAQEVLFIPGNDHHHLPQWQRMRYCQLLNIFGFSNRKLGCPLIYQAQAWWHQAEVVEPLPVLDLQPEVPIMELFTQWRGQVRCGKDGCTALFDNCSSGNRVKFRCKNYPRRRCRGALNEMQWRERVAQLQQQ